MPLGIRATNDFAFKKIFGSPENKIALISLLNAILDLRRPIVDVTLENPYNLQDFAEDKLSILDVKAVDQSGAIYDIEMQLTIFEGLIQRIVYYGCKLYTGQLLVGDDYSSLRSAFSILLVNGILWPDANQVHHAFRLVDQKSGRVLEETLEVHTLELGRYNMTEADLRTAGMLDCWLYWFLHAHEYEPEALRNLFPQPPIRQATEAITRIAQITEDKAMYDARETARQDQVTAINSALRRGRVEGEIEGEIKVRIETVQDLQKLLGVPVGDEQGLRALGREQLQSLTRSLQEKLRNRTPL
jgi:predicted transposase/invertase (TIGR01784 family)